MVVGLAIFVSMYVDINTLNLTILEKQGSRVVAMMMLLMMMTMMIHF